MKNKVNDQPLVIETYKGYELQTRREQEGSPYFSTLIFLNGEPKGGTFSGEINGDPSSIEKAKAKIDKY